MKCPDCEGTGYDTWFVGDKKIQDHNTPCINCNEYGKIKEDNK